MDRQGETEMETHTRGTKHLMKKNVNSLPHEDAFLRVQNETSGDLSLFIPIICIIYYRDNVLEGK